MFDVEHQFLPVMTSKAGLSITPANWEEVHIKTPVFYLDSLLLKPGQELLKKIENLCLYLGWNSKAIINASLCKANKEGIVTLISPYNGSRISIHHNEIVELLLHLKPKAAILPPDLLQHVPEFWNYWNEDITPFFPLKDLNQEMQQYPHGVYKDLNEFPEKELLDKHLKQWSHLPQYLLGSYLPETMQDLTLKRVWIESDTPASLALEGKVFNQQGVLSLTEVWASEQFEPIDPSCNCPTCSRGFTKAYLHHLYFHTPLLTYRFLIQHNIHWCIRNSDLGFKSK